jgi:23S rRNA (guanine2445-N2)-methyltransferase / 23S rRNA (guanine2069-N7)-methyltransferase
MMYSLFISCPKGLEYLLEEELKDIGLGVSRVSPQGVYGEGSLALIYKICLWSRLANRVQLILFSGQASNQEAIYQLCYEYPWPNVFAADKTLAIEFHGSSAAIRNTMFGAQVVKDGVVDQYRANTGTRPTILRDNPDIKLHAHLKNDILTVSLDLTGYSLHQRGYRIEAGPAPLKENVAAALLIRAGWPKRAKEGAALLDPFCGAGTIIIEAWMMAANAAPGLLRDDQSFQHWTEHQPTLWKQIRADALEATNPVKIKISGTDTSPKAIDAARANADRAGAFDEVSFDTRALCASSPTAENGLVVCNPPYGERMGDETSLIPLYKELGQTLYQHFQKWDAFVLTSNPLLAKAIGLRVDKQYTIYNGALECKLYCISLDAQNKLKTSDTTVLSDHAAMLLNRLQKNHQHLQKWAKRHEISCYRVYDKDLPEYAFAIDIYNDYAVLQEYTAPNIIAAHKVERRALDVLQVAPTALGMSPEHLVIKQRKPQKGSNQYQKIQQKGHTMVVAEGQARLIVNLYDYLDTGLFLDHRLLRLTFAKLPKATRFLNCFCYTASASVHAAIAGAITTNVDLSNTYLAWAEDNFKLNSINLLKHQFIQEDCMEYLKRSRDRFDVIFLDPPSFSNSKRMHDVLDIQRDHAELIHSAMRLLYPGGTLYFSTNLRHFKLDLELSTEYSVKDISADTIDIDFKRNKRIHQCFIFQNE